MEIKRGDIYYATLEKGFGSEQNGYRPVLIIQNDIGNKFSSTVIATAITSKTAKNISQHISIFPRKQPDCRRIPSFYWSKFKPWIKCGWSILFAIWIKL